MIFPERLKNLRKNKKITQEELGKRINVTKVSVSGYENGNRMPDTETLQNIADYFNVSIDYLLGRSENKIAEDEESSQPVHNNSLDELNQLIQEHGIEQFGFFDIDKWKKLGPEQIDEIRRHFEWVVQKAKELEEEDD